MPKQYYKWDFFLAHASCDLSVAEALFDLLTPNARVFLDSKQLLLGDNWDEKIAAAQRESIVTIVLVGASTDNAYYEREEIAAAIDLSRHGENEHRVVPIFLIADGQENALIPYGLRRKHSLFLLKPSDIPVVAKKLSEFLGILKTMDAGSTSGNVNAPPPHEPIRHYQRRDVSLSRLSPILDLRIRNSEESSHSVDVSLSIPDRGIYFEDIRTKIDSDELFLYSMDSEEYAIRLAKMLFHDELRLLISRWLGELQAFGQMLRLRLRLDSQKLRNLYWELLELPSVAIWLQASGIVLSRLATTMTLPPPHKPTTKLPLRVLAVIASPKNSEGYGFQLGEEIGRDLRGVLSASSNTTTEYLESGTANPPTIERICESLAHGVDLVHFLAFSRNARDDRSCVLFLEDLDGMAVPLRSGQLVARIRLLPNPPTFCFFAGCETSGMANDIVAQTGIPASIGMNGLNSIDTTNRFTTCFYDNLFRCGVADLAVYEARQFIQGACDAHFPVLSSRLPNNTIFNY